MQCDNYSDGKGKCNAKTIELKILEKTTFKVLKWGILANMNITQDLYWAILSSVNILDSESKIDELNIEITSIWFENDYASKYSYQKRVNDIQWILN